MENKQNQASVLECRALTKRYLGGKEALSGATCSVQPGRIVGLLGPNGSGKTTLMKLCNGLLQPTSGEVLICGMKPCAKTKALVSYLPDKEYLPANRTVMQLIAMFTSFYADFDPTRARELLNKVSIDPSKRLSQLSKGMREKVQLILAMSRRARLYLLDEPIGGIDPAARDYILNTILTNYAPDAAVIISTHLIADVESVLNDVIFIRDGQIIACDSAEHIRAESGMSIDGYFREVFKCC